MRVNSMPFKFKSPRRVQVCGILYAFKWSQNGHCEMDIVCLEAIVMMVTAIGVIFVNDGLVGN